MYHFPTKEALMPALVDRVVDGWERRLAAFLDITWVRASPPPTYAMSGTTHAELARHYSVDISTIKRILRRTQSAEPGDTFA